MDLPLLLNLVTNFYRDFPAHSHLHGQFYEINKNRVSSSCFFLLFQDFLLFSSFLGKMSSLSSFLGLCPLTLTLPTKLFDLSDCR